MNARFLVPFLLGASALLTGCPAAPPPDDGGPDATGGSTNGGTGGDGSGGTEPDPCPSGNCVIDILGGAPFRAATAAKHAVRAAGELRCRRRAGLRLRTTRSHEFGLWLPIVA